MAQKADRLKEFIKEGYGSPEEMAKILDLGVVMLFYLEENTFSQREVQSVVEGLKRMRSGCGNNVTYKRFYFFDL